MKRKNILCLILVLIMIWETPLIAFGQNNVENPTQTDQLAEGEIAQITLVGEEDYASITSLKLDTPDREYNTEVRWWLAQGSHTDETIKESIKELYDAGFAGIEFAMLNETNVDSSLFSYGSDEWVHDVKLILQECTKYGMSVSFTSGTHWGTANVPGLDPDSHAHSQKIKQVTQHVAAGDGVTGVLSKPSTNGGVTVQTFTSAVAYPLLETYRSDADYADPMKIDSENFIDLTGEVVDNSDGTLSLDWTAPSGSAHGYVLFTFWQQGTGNASTPAVDTSYDINYFHRDGVDALMEYWESYLFADEELVSLIRENGNVQLFMDSLEVATSQGDFMFWSSDMDQEFIDRKGYDIRPYLPLFIGTPDLWTDAVLSYTGKYDFDGDEGATLRRQIRNDLYDVHTALLMEEMMLPLKQWLNEEYGIKLRAQISYGEYLEISLPIQAVDYPENETRNARDQVDLYRVHAGGAHLQNKVYSSETGAHSAMNYGYSMQESLWDNYNQYAGGVNRVIWHGYSSIYGPQQSVAWPGYEAGMGTIFGRWGVRELGYKDYQEYNDHLGRLQTVLRAGVPQVDLAILYLDYGYMAPIYGEDALLQQEHQGWIWEDLTLEDAGYTYDYFAPQYLELDEVQYSATEGLLAADGPAYQALMVYQEMMPLSSAEALLTMAQAGMKVVLVDGAMVNSPYHDGSEARIAEIKSAMLAMDNVVEVADQAAAYGALKAMDVSPRAEYGEISDDYQLLNVMRKDEDATYLYLYNYYDYNYDYYNDHAAYTGNAYGFNKDVDTEITLDGMFIPYVLDTWTGEISPVSTYRYEGGKTILPLELESGNVAVYILKDTNGEALHVVTTDAESVQVKESEMLVRATESGIYAVEMSDGKSYSVEVEVPAPASLTGWDVTIENWQAGDLSEARTETTELGNYVEEYTYLTDKQEITLTLDELDTWNNLPEVGKYVSGIGSYETTFNWDTSAADGAYLDLGAIVQTATVYVNGNKSPDVNITNAIVDISELLVDGSNRLEIVITSSLTNRIMQMNEDGSTMLSTYAHEGVLRSLNFSTFSYYYYFDHVWKYFENGLPQAVLVPYVETSVEIVDKGGLEALYNEYKDMEQGEYSDESWKTLQDALGDAEKVLSDSDSIQEDVDAAEQSIRDALDSLAFIITASAGPNGAISPAGEISVSEGGSGRFVVTPDDGYEVDEVLVDGRPARLESDSSYTFTNVVGRHAIEARFKEIDTPTPPPTTVHTIRASANEGGIVPEKTEVDEGGDAQINVVADEGYKLVAILVDGVSVDLKDMENDRYTIEDVLKDMTLSALFVKDQSTDFTAKFSDVPSTAANGDTTWYYEAVNILAGLGIVNGTSETTYEPGGNLKRSEFTKLVFELAVTLGMDVDQVDQVPFSDVESTSWAYGYIGWAYANELVEGYDGDRFGPDDEITRQDMAVLIKRFFEKVMNYDLPGDNEIDFIDESDINSYAKSSVEYVVRTGLMEGHDTGEFKPANSTLRSHAAQVLYNYLIF